MPPSPVGPHDWPRSGADLLLNVRKTPSGERSRNEGMAWYSSRPLQNYKLYSTEVRYVRRGVVGVQQIHTKIFYMFVASEGSLEQA